MEISAITIDHQRLLNLFLYVFTLRGRTSTLVLVDVVHHSRQQQPRIPSKVHKILSNFCSHLLSLVMCQHLVCLLPALVPVCFAVFPALKIIKYPDL